MNMKQFVTANRIRMTCEMVDENPNASDWHDAYHYKCVLRHKKSQMTTYFSQGYGISDEPKAEDVLNCLAMDSNGIDNCRSFEDWCSDYGYDTDSRKAEKIYNTVGEQAKKLARFLGHDLYRTLTTETETM